MRVKIGRVFGKGSVSITLRKKGFNGFLRLTVSTFCYANYRKNFHYINDVFLKPIEHTISKYERVSWGGQSVSQSVTAPLKKNAE